MVALTILPFVRSFVHWSLRSLTHPLRSSSVVHQTSSRPVTQTPVGKSFPEHETFRGFRRTRGISRGKESARARDFSCGTEKFRSGRSSEWTNRLSTVRRIEETTASPWQAGPVADKIRHAIQNPEQRIALLRCCRRRRRHCRYNRKQEVVALGYPDGIRT